MNHEIASGKAPPPHRVIGIDVRSRTRIDTILLDLTTALSGNKVATPTRLALSDSESQRTAVLLLVNEQKTRPTFVEFHSNTLLIVLARLTARRSILHWLALANVSLRHSFVAITVVDELDIADQVLRRALGSLRDGSGCCGGVDGGSAAG